MTYYKVPPNIIEYDCSYQDLTELDLSEAVDLVILTCSYNKLTTLDCSNCPKLRTISCEHNYLNTLRIKECLNLESIYCSFNELTLLQCQSQKLRNLSCADNRLRTILILFCSKLKYLYCMNNQLLWLELSYNINLCSLICYNNKLTELDVSWCSKLKEIDCSDNLIKKLTTFSPSNSHSTRNAKSLITINVTNNKLLMLDISTNLLVTDLLCCNNPNLYQVIVQSAPPIHFYIDNDKLVTLTILMNIIDVWKPPKNMVYLKYCKCSHVQFTVCPIKPAKKFMDTAG
jgi:hypothetical protein